MKKLIMLALASLAAGVGAQTTCNTVGNFTFCSDGTSYNRIGNFTYGSDGSSANRVGNTTFITPPPVYVPQPNYIQPIRPIQPIQPYQPYGQPTCYRNVYGYTVCN